jgi:hypothetical protein
MSLQSASAEHSGVALPPPVLVELVVEVEPVVTPVEPDTDVLWVVVDAVEVVAIEPELVALAPPEPDGESPQPVKTRVRAKQEGIRT